MRTKDLPWIVFFLVVMIGIFIYTYCLEDNLYRKYSLYGALMAMTIIISSRFFIV